MQTPSLERNLKLIPLHQALSSSMVYLPVFVLFTRDNFGVSGALQIASLTYLFIVVLEVPSGWMSDLFGRVPTLSLARRTRARWRVSAPPSAYFIAELFGANRQRSCRWGAGPY